MKNRYNYLHILVLFFSMQYAQIYGQQTEIDTNIQSEYNHAIKLFNSKAYAASQKYFIKVSEKSTIKNDLKANADYYDAMCAIKLNQTNADKKVIRFVNNYPSSTKKDRAYFNVGNYYFANKKELNFKMGYAFLSTRNLDLAKNKFVLLINDPK